MIRLFTFIVFFICFISTSVLSHTIDLSDQLQSIQSKLEALNSSDETIQKKNLKEIYLKSQQVLLDHQTYLTKTQHYSEQLANFPQQLENLEQQKNNVNLAQPNLSELKQLALSEMVQRNIETQAKLSEYQNQQQKILSEITTLREQTVTNRNELAAANSARNAESAELLPELDLNDAKVVEALRIYETFLSQALADKVRMLELEALALPKAAEIATLQEEFVLRPVIQQLIEESEWLAIEINLKRKAETEIAVEKSGLVLEESEWKHPILLVIVKQNEILATALNDYIERSSKLIVQKARNENRLNLIINNYVALQQRLTLYDDDEALGSEIRKQFKYVLTKPNTKLTQKKLNIAKLELFQLEQEKLQMQDDKAYLKRITKGYTINPDSAAYPDIMKAFQELKTFRLQVIDKFIEILREYLKELEQYASLQHQLLEKIDQYESLLKENLLLTRNAKPIYQLTTNDIDKAITWFVTDKTQSAFSKLLDRVGLVSFIITILVFVLLSIFWWFAWPHYLVWEKAGKEAWGKVKQDKIIYSVRLLVFIIFQSLLFASPFFFIYLVLEHSINTEINRAFSQTFYVATIAAIFGNVTFQISRPSGLLSQHFKFPIDFVEWLHVSIKHYGPAIAILCLITAFTDAIGEDMVRHVVGRISFITACFLLALLSLDWIGVTKVGKSLYRDKQLNSLKNPKLWASLFFLQLLYLIAIAATGYYFAALYQAILIFETIVWVMICSFIFLQAYRGLLIAQRRIAYKRAIEKREEMIALRTSTSGKAEAEWVDENYMDVETISKQSHTLLTISVWGLLLLGLSGIWVDLLPTLGFIDKIVIWQTSAVSEGETIVRLITLETLLVALIILVLSFIAAHNLPGTLEILVLRHLSLDTGTGYAITTLLKYVIIILGITIMSQKLGVEWSNIHWLVAALGVGVGFGLQEIVANFVSGLILLFERPIRIGDTVTLSDVTGTVSKIHIRATTLIDADRKEVIVPNKIFITQQFINWTLSDEVTRIRIPVGIAYGSDCDKARELLLEVAHSNPLVLREPEPLAVFADFGASTLNFELRVYAGQLSDRLDLAHDLNMEINRRFAAEGIEIAFPQLDVHLHRVSARK
ncbi:MAG: mechanosensitive ion channel [Nitrosomonas sp.]|nr:mechanosensitive ion channel [Nitrosomonas sp.]